MPIKVTCEKCGGVLHAPDDAGGKKGRCPNCQNVLPIPFDGPRAPSGFGAASSPANPPAGMAFGSPPSNPMFPNADAKRPAAPPPFGAGARGESPGVASSTPGLGASLAGAAPPGIGSTMGGRSSAPFGARPAPASAGMPLAPEAGGWRSAASGLRWVQVAVVMFFVSIVAPCGVAAYGANGGQALMEKPGFLKWDGLSQFHEIRLVAFLIPAVWGALFLIVGRFKVGSVPASSCARGAGKLGAFFTLLSLAGFIALAVMLGLGMKDGTIPALHPEIETMKIDLSTSARVTRYLNKILLDETVLPGQVQRFGLLAFVVFGKLAELFFGCTLGRISTAARNPVAAGRVTRCYLFFALLGALAAFGALAYELYGVDSAKEVWSPKWYAMPQGTRVGIVCGVAGLVTLILTLAYLRMLGGVRRACAIVGA